MKNPTVDASYPLMAKLAYEELTTFHVSWIAWPQERGAGFQGLAALAREVYGLERDLVCLAPNDSCQSIAVKKEPLNEVSAAELAKALADCEIPDWRVSLLLTDLCNRDQLPEGNYVVLFSW